MSISTTLTIETENKKITQVEATVFKEMITNEGLSISQMNDQGVRVILFFSSSLACPYCQGTIDDIYELKNELAKLNVVPVVCHAETNQVWNEFVQLTDNNRKFEELLHLERTKWNKYFKLESSVSSLILETLGSGIQELKRLKANGIKGKLSWFSEETKDLLAAIFVVANSKIVSEYRKTSKSERFDLAKLAIDDSFSISVHTSYYYCDYFKKKTVKRLSKEIAEKKRSRNSDIEKETELRVLQNTDLLNMKLLDVLENEKYRQYFKMFCMNQFCIENIIFYEEVLKYKNIPEHRKLLGENIINTFFIKDSLYEINTTEKLMQDTRERVKKNEKNAFDEILTEIQTDILLNVFKEFKNSASFITMLMSDVHQLNPVPMMTKEKRKPSFERLFRSSKSFNK